MTWLTARLKQLITRFSIEQKLLLAGHVQLRAHRTLIPEILIGRDLCRYACVDLGHVPRAKRRQALANQITLLSPWDNVGYSVVWQNGFAQVWFWDREEIAQLLQADSSHLNGFASPNFLAEVIYWVKPAGSGFYVLELENGYDVQYWHAGILSASQWFLGRPSLAQLQRFARAQGSSLSENDVIQSDASWRDKPWDGVESATWGHFFERRLQLLSVGIAISLLAASLQVTAILRWSAEESRLKEETQALAQSAQTLIEARGKARRAQISVRKIQSLLSVPDSLASQLKIVERIPQEFNLSLQTWERNVNQVDMTLMGEVPDTLTLLRAMEQKGMSEVRVEPLAEANKYRIRLILDGMDQMLGGAANAPQ